MSSFASCFPYWCSYRPLYEHKRKPSCDSNAGYHVASDGLDLEYIINLVYVLYLTDCMYVKGVLDGKYELR